MNSKIIHGICKELNIQLGREKKLVSDEKADLFKTQYSTSDIPTFLEDLITVAQKYSLTLIASYVKPEDFSRLLSFAPHPILYFETSDSSFIARIKGQNIAGKTIDLSFKSESATESIGQAVKRTPFVMNDIADESINGKILILTAFPMEAMVSPERATSLTDPTHLSPVQRLFQLLGNEKRDILYIYLYAIVVGLISLSLPLGIQAIINFVSGGMFFSSVYLLAGLVILGVLVGGVLQIMQLTIVETLKQRIFAKAAFEFTYRVPRLRSEAILSYYPPELMNRFFDILTIQKGLPKLLIDITAAVLQIVFGLILLSLYHPFFIVFGFVSVLILTIFAYLYGPKGLQTSIVVSKYKYKVVQWLEDIARTLYSFKLAGNNNLPMEKMDGLLNSYLSYRKKHFKILLTFYWNAVLFKTFVIGGLLVLGAFLVVDRQISLGQFVASEIIIVLFTNSIEKLLFSIETIFHTLTAVDKIGHVTDLPLEKEDGFIMPSSFCENGLSLVTHRLSYQFAGAKRPALKVVSFSLEAGSSLCVTGSNGSGKNTLLKVLSGLLTDYEGGILFNGVSMRDLNIVKLRSFMEKNFSVDDIFEGSILDNITMGKHDITLKQLEKVLHRLDLTNEISLLKDGINTLMVPGGRLFSLSFITRVIIARCVINDPKIVIINDILQNLERSERIRIIRYLTSQEVPWSLIIVSNDPLVMKTCRKVLVLDKGEVVIQGKYDEISTNEKFRELLDYKTTFAF